MSLLAQVKEEDLKKDAERALASRKQSIRNALANIRHKTADMTRCSGQIGVLEAALVIFDNADIDNVEADTQVEALWDAYDEEA